MVIDEEFVIPPDYDVEIASTNGATIVATDGASHFRIDGKLRLEFDMRDESGSIRCVGFGEAVEVFNAAVSAGYETVGFDESGG